LICTAVESQNDSADSREKNRPIIESDRI